MIGLAINVLRSLQREQLVYVPQNKQVNAQPDCYQWIKPAGCVYVQYQKKLSIIHKVDSFNESIHFGHKRPYLLQTYKLVN